MSKSFCVIALVLGGCAVDPIEGASVQSLADCNPLVCPGNSDLLAALGPYELDATGSKASSRGFRITGMTLNGTTVTELVVPGAALRAKTPTASYWGHGLKGLKLTLKHQSGQHFDLLIDDYLTPKVPYYAGGSAQIEGYRILYGEAGGRIEKELCPYGSHVDQGVNGSWAVFWKGDRYDPTSGAIFASNAAVGPWFNISCAGEAPIKMLRARTGGAVAAGSPVDQRQATLNMFTASYCGPGGGRYTKLGQLIAWSDLSGPSAIGAVSSHEAVWDASGAVCLDEPRLVDPGEIDCAIPRCTAAEIGAWPLHGWLLSGNPP